jgi:hypothetical protein
MTNTASVGKVGKLTQKFFLIKVTEVKRRHKFLFWVSEALNVQKLENSYFVIRQSTRPIQKGMKKRKRSIGSLRCTNN